MLVISVYSTEMRDSVTFSLIKKELYINVLGTRSALSVPKERYGYEIITKQFQWFRNGVNNLQN